MKNVLLKVLTVALVCTSTATPAVEPVKADIDARWQAIVREDKVRHAGKVSAEALRAELDANVMHSSLFALWNKLGSSDASKRLTAAWSILSTCVPDGNVSRWNEVRWLKLPERIPNDFMVIDALYVALIELQSRNGGDWLAADLMKAFAKSSHGRYDFFTTCPEEVAPALIGIAERTGLHGHWTPDRVVGHLPIARRVDGIVSDNYAHSEGWQFLDSAMLPTNSGYYAWNRKTGRIARVVSPDDSHVFFRILK